uniref:Uncharacterized protein n=1 Tax=Glossina morsitans morsitans TaxID=37546 RepID=A0A1B0G008_GLOMM
MSQPIPHVPLSSTPTNYLQLAPRPQNVFALQGIPMNMNPQVRVCHGLPVKPVTNTTPIPPIAHVPLLSTSTNYMQLVPRPQNILALRGIPMNINPQVRVCVRLPVKCFANITSTYAVNSNSQSSFATEQEPLDLSNKAARNNDRNKESEVNIERELIINNGQEQSLVPKKKLNVQVVQPRVLIPHLVLAERTGNFYNTNGAFRSIPISVEDKTRQRKRCLDIVQGAIKVFRMTHKSEIPNRGNFIDYDEPREQTIVFKTE